MDELIGALAQVAARYLAAYRHQLEPGARTRGLHDGARMMTLLVPARDPPPAVVVHLHERLEQRLRAPAGLELRVGRAPEADERPGPVVPELAREVGAVGAKRVHVERDEPARAQHAAHSGERQR